MNTWGSSVEITWRIFGATESVFVINLLNLLNERKPLTSNGKAPDRVIPYGAHAIARLHATPYFGHLSGDYTALYCSTSPFLFCSKRM